MAVDSSSREDLSNVCGARQGNFVKMARFREITVLKMTQRESKVTHEEHESRVERRERARDACHTSPEF